MLKNHFKNLKQIFQIWLFLALTIGFSIGFKYYSTFNQPKIDEQAYNEYAHSIIYHHDLNNFRLVDTFVSGTKNKIDFYSWGAGIFLIPFHLYAGILNEIHLDKTTCFWEFNIASTVGSICFFFIFIYFVLEICRKLNLVLSKKDLIIFLLGTPIIWYAFFETDTNQIVFLAYLSFAINSVLEINYFIESRKYLKLTYLGAVFGFANVIDPVGFLYFIGFLVFVYIMLRKRSDTFKLIFCYLIGGFLVFLFDIINANIKFGQTLTSIFFMQKDYFGFIAKKFLIISHLFSPQGVLYLSPLYILCLFGLYSYFESYNLTDSKDLKTRSLISTLIAIFLISVFIKIRYWFPTSIVYGKNLLEHQILFILGFALFIRNMTFFKKICIFVFVTWNTLWLSRYFVDKSNFGFFYELPDFNFFQLIFGRIYTASIFSLKYFPYFLEYFFLWLLFVALLFYILKNVFSQKHFMKIGNTLLVAFFVISISNWIFNSSNTRDITSVAIIKDPDVFFLPTFLEELKKRKAIAQVNGKVEMVDLLGKKIDEAEGILKKYLPTLSPRIVLDDKECRKDWIKN